MREKNGPGGSGGGGGEGGGLGGNGQAAKQSWPKRRRKGARSGGSIPLPVWFLNNAQGPWGFLEPKSWFPRRGHLDIYHELEHPPGIHAQQQHSCRMPVSDSGHWQGDVSFK